MIRLVERNGSEAHDPPSRSEEGEFEILLPARRLNSLEQRNETGSCDCVPKIALEDLQRNRIRIRGGSALIHDHHTDLRPLGRCTESVRRVLGIFEASLESTHAAVQRPGGGLRRRIDLESSEDAIDVTIETSVAHGKHDKRKQRNDKESDQDAGEHTAMIGACEAPNPCSRPTPTGIHVGFTFRPDPLQQRPVPSFPTGPTVRSSTQPGEAGTWNRSSR